MTNTAIASETMLSSRVTDKRRSWLIGGKPWFCCHATFKPVVLQPNPREPESSDSGTTQTEKLHCDPSRRGGLFRTERNAANANSPRRGASSAQTGVCRILSWHPGVRGFDSRRTRRRWILYSCTARYKRSGRPGAAASSKSNSPLAVLVRNSGVHIEEFLSDQRTNLSGTKLDGTVPV